MNSNSSKSGFVNNVSKQMKNMGNQLKNSTSNFDVKKIILITALLIIFVIVVYILVCAYYYSKEPCTGMDKREFWDYLIDFNNRQLCIPKKPAVKDFKLSDIQLPKQKQEVFHIANQDYTYDQAKCKCESYGAKLATREQIIDSYNKGANWCTYGWSNGQYAFYPTQQCEYDRIQEDNKGKPKHEQEFCGKPGLNGGFFPNPYIKFGVNCFGVKPKGESHVLKKPFCPESNFCKLEKNFQASHKLESDEIVAFAPGQWNA